MMPPQPEHADRLTGVDPDLKDFILFAVRELGGRWQVARGATTDKEQAAIFAKGRTVKGEPPYTVDRPLGHPTTEAHSARETAHGVRRYGACAVDVVAINEDGSPDWSPTRYRQLGELAKHCGFEWGGDFVSARTGKPMADLGHVQVAHWRNIPIPPVLTS